MDYKKLCPGCTREKPDMYMPCPYCGFDWTKKQNEEDQLPFWTYLDQGKYFVGKVLGDGGFGITYLGLDMKLQRRVAIKEFYLRGYCHRNSSDPTVYADSDQKAATFERVKNRFIEEGQVLAELGEQAGVVNVHTYFEENNTAYLVMEYVDGKSLAVYRQECGGKIPSEEVFRIVCPVIRALGGVHKRGVVHRDISPDNIMITTDLNSKKRVKLIDFGAAKQYGNYNSDKVIKGGYSPLEQMTPQGQVGPYSDIYSLCATIYTCITGRKVPSALERAKADTLVPPSAMGIAIDPDQEQTLMRGLAVYPEARIQNADELYDFLYVKNEKTILSENSLVNDGISRMLKDMQRDKRRLRRRQMWISFVVSFAFVLVGIGVYRWWIKNKDLQGGESDPQIITQEETQEETQEMLQEVYPEPEDVDCKAYAQDLYDLIEQEHQKQGLSLVRRDELDMAAEYVAEAGARLDCTSQEELSAKMAEIGNRAIEEYKIPNTGWVAYTFDLKEDVAVVKQALDSYVAELNTSAEALADLNNCQYVGVCVSRAENGTFFWAVFYR